MKFSVRYPTVTPLCSIDTIDRDVLRIAGAA